MAPFKERPVDLEEQVNLLGSWLAKKGLKRREARVKVAGDVNSLFDAAISAGEGKTWLDTMSAKKGAKPTAWGTPEALRSAAVESVEYITMDAASVAFDRLGL